MSGISEPGFAFEMMDRYESAYDRTQRESCSELHISLFGSM